MNKAKTILIVEDEMILQDVYKLILTTGGHTVYTANNGVEGLRQLKKVMPDLILLDIFMPLMDGKEFLRNVDLSEYPNTKVLVYSNVSDKATENEMIKLGAHGFILKSSLTPADLLEVVTAQLSTV